MEEHRDSFSDEVMLELGPEKWVGRGSARKGAGRGEKGVPSRFDSRCKSAGAFERTCRVAQCGWSVMAFKRGQEREELGEWNSHVFRAMV